MSNATPVGLHASEPPQPSTQMSPPVSGGSGSSAGRRGSTISLSSLHRPAFLHKLDLSSTAMRVMNVDDPGMFTGGPLASPVTLAPKSARPATSTDIPHDFMAAFEAVTDANNRPVDIDLTLPDTEPANGSAALGNSADKPIELDMDIDMTMSDLFGDATDTSSTDANAGLFSPITADHELAMTGVESNGKLIKQEDLDILALSDGGDGTDDLFASFSQTNNQSSTQSQSQPISSDALSVPSGQSLSNITSSPSPSSMLASFAASQMNTDNQSTSFDFFSQAGSETGMAEMEELFKGVSPT